MSLFINILKLLAGVGLFLFGMYLIEEALKNLSGRRFKLFLQRITRNRLGGVFGGAVITGILQSSSMVSLMVLAFVGAGVFSMQNAMSIILGANLGTTISSWMVAALGFKVNIEVLAYPAVAMGGLLLVLFNTHKTIKHLAFFLLGFGLLFISLSFMKTAMEEEVKHFDLSKYSSLPLVMFLLIGFILTLLVQSSSVTMALTLSAMHAGVINILPAAALVLGSETGTTIKILIGAAGGSAIKKRVALGNFLFNLFLMVAAYIFIRPLIFLITDILLIRDPLYELVTFSSLINFLSILIFLPILGPYTKFLERFFIDSAASATAFIGSASEKEPQTALDLFRRETAYFLHNAMLFNVSLFDIDTSFIRTKADYEKLNWERKYFSMNAEEKYEFIKHQQGELQVFYLSLRNRLQADQTAQLNQLISAVRSGMYSVKCAKDISTNISNLKRSSKNVKFDFFMLSQKATQELYERLAAEFGKENEASFEKLKTIFESIQLRFKESLNLFYIWAQESALEDLDLTVAINFNRELYTSNKAMLMAVKDFLLDETEAGKFNEIPVYLT